MIPVLVEPATISRRTRQSHLDILGVRVGAPCREDLGRLVRAHQERIPFENISKIYYRERFGLNGIADIERYLDGIGKRNFGGTCVSNSYHFFNLLAELGYDAELCGAAMSHRNAHLVITVALDGRRYLVDVGYGAPFFAPLALDLSTDVTIDFGGDRYLLEPRDQDGNSRLHFFRGEKRVHGYLVRPQPITEDDLAASVARTFTADATFLQAILLVRYESGRGVRIHNLSLSESTPTARTTRELSGREELVTTIVEHFQMPQDIVRSAVGAVREFGEIYT